MRCTISRAVPARSVSASQEVATSWLALTLRAGTAREIVQRMHAEAVRVMKRPEVVERFARTGVETRTSSSPEEFVAYIKAETEKWGGIIRATGARAD